MNNHKIEPADKTSIVTHTRIGDKNLNIYSGKWHIPADDLPEFYKLYKDFVFVKKNKEYLTEKQLQSGGPMAVDLDLRYSSGVTTRLHNSSHIEDIVCDYCEELKKHFSFDNNTKFYIWIFEKPNVNQLADNSLTKDGIHLIFGLSVPYSIQLQIRKSLIENGSDLLKNLPLINTMESVLDEGISKGTTNWQLFGSCKPANQAYEMVTKYEIGFDETDSEITMGKVDFNMLDDFDKISVQCQAPAFELNSSVDIGGDYIGNTKHTPACDNGITDATNYNELKFYSENGAFAYAMKSGCHVNWIALAGMLVSILPAKEAFECWKIATLKNGTSNKKDEYEAKFKDIKMLEEDPIKAMNILKKIVKKEAPTIFNNWKLKQKDILNEWKNKVCEDIKAQKELLRLQKVAEKEAEKEAKAAEKEAKAAEKEEKRNEKDVFMEKRKNENIFIDSDNEACDIIFEHLKHTIIYVNDRFYYKYKNCWIKDKDKISALLIVFIAESNIYKINDKYDLKPYGQNTKTAKNIMELLYAKVRVKCSTNIKYSLFHSSTKKKLCFLDGVLDFEKKTFTLWKDMNKGNPIYTTVIIQRKFKSYFENPNRHFIDKIKNDIFYNLFGGKTTLALKFFARAIAGCCEDKNFMSYSGNRNSGKGILYTGMAAAFEEYVTSFNLENMVCKRENNKSSDIAKENAWLLNFEFARIAIAQETDENENDNIKNSLKINNKVMKTIMSGGDEIQARALYQDPTTITLDVTLGFFGNNELAISGEDSSQHHFKFNGVKQFITEDKYNSYENMGAVFLSAYAIRDDNLKDTVKTDDYINAMVYLLYENFENKSLTIEVTEPDDDGEEIEINIRALIFNHYVITNDDKDRVSKNTLFELLKKDKKKIKAELKQLGCNGGDTCRITIETVDDKGATTKKQIPAFKNLKLKL